MRAGRLRFRVDVEQAIEVQNALNEVERTWTCIRRISVDIEPIRGTERYTLNQEKADIDTKVTARASAVRGLTPKMRLIFADPIQQRRRIFDIDSIIKVRERESMAEMYCKEAA